MYVCLWRGGRGICVILPCIHVPRRELIPPRPFTHHTQPNPTHRNVNDGGFFSIEVLRQACKRFGDLSLLRSVLLSVMHVYI